MRTIPTARERVEGGLLGLLVGDALGVPYEFHPPAQIPPLDAIEMDPPPGFDRAHARVPPGPWSDDGAQALCLLASLLARDGFDLVDFARRLVDWYREGAMAVGGIVFDIGIQTEHAIGRLIEGTAPAEAGPRDDRANGNGSLMRVLPLALWHRGDDEALVRDAHAQSVVTHGHARAQAACAVYCLWARYELEGDDEAWVRAVRRVRQIYSAQYPAHNVELVERVLPGFAEPRGTGYVVDCLHSALAACAEPSYEAIVKAAIARGNDTDTTACVAGGIAGIRHGRAAIPERWVSRLRGRAILEPLLESLASRV
jgi:ADP-ribosylglycohydrolase